MILFYPVHPSLSPMEALQDPTYINTVTLDIPAVVFPHFRSQKHLLEFAAKYHKTTNTLLTPLMTKNQPQPVEMICNVIWKWRNLFLFC